MQNLENLVATLPALECLVYNRAEREFVSVMRDPHGFVRDGMLFVSAEYGDNAADYYGERGHSWINPALENWVTENGGYWEWYDTGSIVFAN